MSKVSGLLKACIMVFFLNTVMADGDLSGSVTDQDGVSLSEVSIQLRDDQERIIQGKTTLTGVFEFLNVPSGKYRVNINHPDYELYQTFVSIAEGSIELFPVLVRQKSSNQMVIKVSAKKAKKATSMSSTEISAQAIEYLPGGSEASLPKLIAATNPGVVEGGFNQLFFRGGHGNVQYQVDGVQMPDAYSNSFSQVFSTRNIQSLEIIRGGIPAEYGQRLNGVINIITKTGPDQNKAEVELNYGSYNTFSPHVLYGWSDKTGRIRSFFSVNYNQTNRGLNTPQPINLENISQGGSDSVHNFSQGHSEFSRLDWQLNPTNKISILAFYADQFYQIPNYPESFSAQSSFFAPRADTSCNAHSHEIMIRYVPHDTNDTAQERNGYLQTIYRYDVSEKAFFQLAPYWKYSRTVVKNDLQKDLATTVQGPYFIPGSQPLSFKMDRVTNHFGLKSDYTLRLAKHTLKAGAQLQASDTQGFLSITRSLQQSALEYRKPNRAYFEGIYIQDDYAVLENLTLNVGLRWDATQFALGDDSAEEMMIQPRIGLSVDVTDATKLHVFYGKLFQPAAAENLRFFYESGDRKIYTYDVKAERDDYFEAGVAQTIDNHAINLVGYYAFGKNMLDHAQLLNTPLSQPFNFAEGYRCGAELGWKAQLFKNWSSFVNYSYSIAKGKGISGGIWANDHPITSDYQFMDHVQLHTVNSGILFTYDRFWWSTQGLYGSGFSTGAHNNVPIRGHFQFNTTVGYKWNELKLFFDILNILDDRYPITISNSFNGTQYAAGRQFFIHAVKEF